MTPIRLVMHLVNPGEYTLLHSTYLSPSAHVERIKTQGPKFKRQDFSARAFEHFTVSCFRNFVKARGGGKVVRTLLCFFVFFFLVGIVIKQGQYERQYGTECAGVAHIAP